MRHNKNRAPRDYTGRGAVNALGGPPVHTAAQRETMRQGLRILARIIAHAHLRRESSMPSLAPPSNGGPGS